MRDPRPGFDRDLRGSAPVAGHTVVRDPRDPREREMRDPRGVPHDADMRGGSFDPRSR